MPLIYGLHPLYLIIQLASLFPLIDNLYPRTMLLNKVGTIIFLDIKHHREIIASSENMVSLCLGQSISIQGKKAGWGGRKHNLACSNIIIFF